MTVKELIRILQTHEPNREVIMAKDGEGNAFSPFMGVERASYAGGEVMNDEYKGGQPAIVLWPMG